MWQENVDIVRASIESYSTGDRDAFLDFMAEDVEIRPMPAVFPRHSRFADARSSGATSPT
jgi:ketosteroid isomerase-like protein